MKKYKRIVLKEDSVNRLADKIGIPDSAVREVEEHVIHTIYTTPINNVDPAVRICLNKATVNVVMDIFSIESYEGTKLTPQEEEAYLNFLTKATKEFREINRNSEAQYEIYSTIGFDVLDEHGIYVTVINPLVYKRVI